MNSFWALACLCLPGAGQEETVSPAELARRIDVHVDALGRGGSATSVEDGEYLRRVMLDLLGRPPGLEETRAFLADADPEKRTRVVDELLGTHGFAHHWARRFAEVLLGDTRSFRVDVSPELASDLRERMAAEFVRWLARKIRDDRPWGETVGEMASALGTTDRRPELAWKLSFYRGGEPTALFGCAAPQQLMGITMTCARCHDHPFDRWTTQDHYAMAAFVVRQTVTVIPASKESRVRVEIGEGTAGEASWLDFEGRKGPVIPPRLMTTGGVPKPGEGRAAALGRLLTDPGNPQLSRMMVNRVWSWLMGRGIVHPVDDFSVRNKPLSPKLLEELQRGFDRNNRSVRFLIQSICRSEAYRRSSEGAGEMRREDFSRGLIRPLTTEQLVNSLQVATRLVPETALGEARALSVAFSPPLLRPPCEVTPVTVNRWVALYARNNDEVRGWVREGGVLNRIREGEGTLVEKVDAMFLAALSRRASPSERARLAAFLGVGGEDRFEDAYWALLNSHEFLTRH